MQHKSVLTETSFGARPAATADSRRSASRIDPAQLAAARRVMEHTRRHGPQAASNAGSGESIGNETH